MKININSLSQKYSVRKLDENDSLIGLMDLILDYPKKEFAFIGLFMTDTRYQNRGVGSQIISDMIPCLKSYGYQEIQLGVDKGNPQSYSF